MEQITPSQNKPILYKDAHPLEQPDNTITFGLNIINSSDEGEHNIVINEPSNVSVLGLSYRVVGSIPMNNNQVCLLLTDDIVSVIAVFENGNVTELIKTDCLGFTTCNLSKGLFKIANGCERVITLYNGVYEDKYINLDKLDLYYTDAAITWLNANPGSTIQDYYDDTGLYGWDCNKMKLNPNFIYPNIDLVQVNDYGGSLQLGVYQFALELIDSNFNRIAFTNITNPIPIYDNSIQASYFDIDGGYNINNHTVNEGGLPATNKSISLRFDNIAAPISYVRLCVIAANTGDGLTRSSYIVNDYIPADDTINYTFVGINTNKDVTIDLAEITVPKVNYITSTAQEIVDTRLVRANLQEKIRDWGKLQKYASTIKTSYIVKPSYSNVINQTGDNTTHNAKSPRYYFEGKTFMRDEVYSFGIVYVFNDGTYSPVYHIPGRPKDINPITDSTLNGITEMSWVSRPPYNGSWDGTEYTVVADGTEDYISTIAESEAKCIGWESGTVQRWELYNTAVSFRSTPNPNMNPSQVQRGVLAYYECQDVYPEINDCNGNIYWGEDYWGNKLEGTPIRHHKMPDATLEPIADSCEDGDVIYNINIEFDNIQIPTEYASEIVGYYMVYGEKNNTNSTVLDKGLGCDFRFIKSSETFNGSNTLPSDFLTVGVSDEYDRYYIYQSPNQYLLNILSRGTYVKQEYRYNDSDNTFFALATPSSCDDTNYQTITCPNYYTAPESLRQKQLHTLINVNKTDGLPESRVSFNIDDRTYYSTYYSNNLAVLAVQPLDTLLVGSVTTYSGTFDNRLSSIDTAPNIYNEYISIKSFNPNVDANLFSITYYLLEGINTASNIILGGDSIITNPNFVKARTFENPGYSAIRRVWNTYVESRVNIDLRHHNQDCAGHYINSTDQNMILNYLCKDANNSCDLSDCNVYVETLLYNNDYSIFNNNLNIFRPLPITYNYCSDCQGSFPNRIVWSPKSYEEQNSENWKINYANDYVDLQADTGSIQELYFDRNKLVVKTQQSAWLMIPNPQEIQTSVSTAYIGTGDFLSIPPQMFIKKSFGYGGTVNRFASVTSEYGHTWVDINDGKVFNMTEGIDELSMNGMSTWFMENLAYNLTAQLASFGITYCCTDSTVSGIGLNAIYDPYFKRYILHKRDFAMMSDINFQGYKPEGNPSTSINRNLYIDTDCVFWHWTGNRWDVIQLTNPEYFENKSWTIAYSYTKKAWCSFYSYQPNFMFNDNTYFYTTKDFDIYKHLHGKQYNTFYTYLYPSIIEFVVKDYNTFNTQALHWVGEVTEYNNTTKTYTPVYSTFTRAMVYNDVQNTGEFYLGLLPVTSSPFENINYYSIGKYVIKTDNNYKLGQVHDLSLSQPIVSKNWNDTSSYYYPDGQGYIDLVQYNVGSKNQFELNPLRGKYIYTRLFFDNEANYKMTLNLNLTNKLNSVR